jgi:hypothetical protein
MFGRGTVHGNRSSRGSISSKPLESDPIPPPLESGRGWTRARGALYGLDPGVAASQATRASEELGFGEARRVCARPQEQSKSLELSGVWSGVEQ